MAWSPRYHFAIFAFVALSFLALYATALKPWLPILDETQYLGYARTLSVSGTYAFYDSGPQADTTPGREPLYSVALSGLFLLDRKLRTASLDDISNPRPELIGKYVHVRYLNAALLALTAIASFATAWLLARRWLAAYVAGLYLLFNLQTNKDLTHAISDYLAMCLAAVGGLALVWALRRRSMMAFAQLGVALALLVLTKAIFGLFVGVLIVVLLGAAAANYRTQGWLPLLRVGLTAAVFVAIVGGWMLRNEQRYGQLVLTDNRGAIALSSREVFDHMTGKEYAAAFVYWLRGPGNQLARKLFDVAHWHNFELYSPDGFYMQSYTRNAERLAALERAGATPRQAEAALSMEVVKEIAGHGLMYLATMLPVFYRGIWCDEFIVFGLPAMIWLVIRGLRRRDGETLAALCIPLASLALYTALTLNIPRYQFTALPGWALSTGLAVQAILDWWRSRRVQRSAAETAAVRG